MILGIDLGNLCGWAPLSLYGERRDSGTWDLRPRKATKARPASHPAERWIAMCSSCSLVLKKWRPECIAYERPVGRADGGGRATLLNHGALLAQLEIAAFDFDVDLPFVALSPAEWKRGVGLPGNADKPTYIRKANELFGLNFVFDRPCDIARSENECAALLIALAAIKLGKVPS